MPRVIARNRATIVLLAALSMTLALGVAACGSATSDRTTTSAPSATSEAPHTQAPQTLIVSAASSLKAVFSEIGKTFDRANNAVTTFNFEAAGTLQKQIEGGAPADVFASASLKQVNALLEKSLVDSASVKTFASNEIVLVVPADSTLGITSFEDLTKADVKKITYGDPKTTAHGVAAEEILTKLGLMDQVKSKVIYATNVTQTLEYVTRGEVDAGIMFVTEAMTAKDKVKIVATSNASWHSTISYPVAIVSDSQKKTLGQAFIDFLTGPNGQAILKQYGFLSTGSQ